jgi:hypothetical protein
MGGKRLMATGRCVFAMQITQKVSFNEYWLNTTFLDKRPVRNGSYRMMVGDNIYHLDGETNNWRQADSHHSNSDGSPNLKNLGTDTKSDRVLISRHFFYFGIEAPLVPTRIMQKIGFRNGIGHRVYRNNECDALIAWLEKDYKTDLNTVRADPYDFALSDKRYSGKGSKII